MIVCGLPAHVNAEKMEESSGGSQLEAMYEEMQAEVQAEMEGFEQKAEAQQGANAAYAEIEEAMRVNPEAEENVYAEEYGGAYINENNKLVVCVTAEDLAQDIDANVVSELSGETAQQAQDVMAGDIEYKVVAHSYNELAGISDEIADNYEKFYPVYGEGTSEYELLSTITGIGLSQKRNVVTVGINELSEQKITTFVSLFGDYGCVEFEEYPPAQDAETYYPGRKIFILVRNSKGIIEPSWMSIGFRCKRTVSSGTTQYGYVTCGHGCKDSVDGYIYVKMSDAENSTNPKGKICDPTYLGSVDASYIKRLNKEIKIASRTYYDASGGRNGDKLKTNAYMGVLAEGRVVYKCGAKTYKTSGTISDNYYKTTMNGVSFINLVKVEPKFCEKGDSGGIVYTYANGEYWPCGIIKGCPAKEELNVYGFYVKASEIAHYLNVQPY